LSTAVPTVSRASLVARRFLRKRLALGGVAFLLALFALAYLSPLLTKWQYDQLDTTAFLTPPSVGHWFGTTQNGFDVFALTMRGMQKSLVIGLLGALISTGLAAVVGAFAGYFGGRLNTLLVGLIDLLLVLPGFLIISILSPAFHGRTWLIFVLLLAAFQWMITARIVRGMTLSLKEREFVHAARFMGVPGSRIIFRHILPNVLSHVIVAITLAIPTVVLLESFLGFLGFAVKPPLISWGLMLQDTGTFSVIGSYPWILSPVVFVLITVFAFNALGDGLRDAVDPY